MSRAFERASRIRWRRGQWASVEAFLRGEAGKRRVGPGMGSTDRTTVATDAAVYSSSPRDGVRQMPMSPRLDQLEGRTRR